MKVYRFEKQTNFWLQFSKVFPCSFMVIYFHGFFFFFRFTDILTFCSVNAPQDASYEICEINFRCRVNQ